MSASPIESIEINKVEVAKKRQKPGIGTNFSTYTARRTFSGVIREQRESRLQRYLDQGGVVNGKNNERAEEIAASSSLRAFSLVTGGRTKKGRGSATQQETMIKYENAILRVFKDEPIAIMYNKWEEFVAGDNRDVDIVFVQITTTQLLLLLSLMSEMTDGSKTFNYEDDDEEQVSIEVRGNGYKTLQKFLGAARDVAAQAGTYFEESSWSTLLRSLIC